MIFNGIVLMNIYGLYIYCIDLDLIGENNFFDSKNIG